MNDFRASLRPGEARKGTHPVQQDKQPRSLPGEGLDRIPVPRDAVRTADHRDDDRHRLLEHMATVSFRGTEFAVDLINLSGGGAMIRAGFKPDLWERVDLNLGEHGTVECAVLWIRGDRLGLEFAHETQIGGDPATRDAMLLEVLQSRLPDRPAAPDDAVVALPEPAVPNDAARRGEPRHPLIWSGLVHFNHDSTPVRVRNISPNGALVESPLAYPSGAEVYLDLGNAGQMFATVCWSRSDQVGLAFTSIYDIARLAKARPEVAPQRWTSPDYMREDHGDSSPWGANWGRLSVEEMKSSLEGFLKR